MDYDPFKALQAAGVLPGNLPASVQEAIGKLSQSEVDAIISQANQRGSAAGSVAPWLNPAVNGNNGTVMSCFCGLWSGSGSGAAV